MKVGDLCRDSCHYRPPARRLLFWMVWMTLLPLRADARSVIEWDFSRGMHGWKGNHYVTDLTYSRRGLSFTSTGVDPWIEGPAIDLRIDRIIKVTVRMHSNGNSTGELFYGTHFQAGHSVRFAVNNDADWHDYELIIMEPLGSNTRFRLDPATSEGRIGVAFIRVDELTKWDDPPYLAPVRPEPATTTAGAVTSGPLELRYVGTGIGDFTIEVDNREMALGYGNELLGVLFGDVIEWLDINDGSVTAESDSDGVIVTAYHNDSGGGAWEIRREIRPGPIDGAITMDVRIRVDADRDVMCIPWLTILAGMGTFGPTKSQALLAGLEYLSDEPSSSEADISTPEHIRRVPDPVKVTFPLMAISAEGRYIGLVWEPSQWAGPMFDSPDRIFNSGAHVMGLTGPAVGENRFENDLLAHTPIKLTVNEPITARLWIIGGQDDTAVPAVQAYVDLKGLPIVPQFEGGLQSAAQLLAHGWVYSKIRQGGLFRHAVWNDRFGAVPAPDAAMFMDWLAVRLSEANVELIAELHMAIDHALTSIPQGQHMDGGVSHVRPPMTPLLFGDIGAFVQRRYDAALDVMEQFDVNGVKIYQSGEVDYGKTHFANHANGYGAGNLVSILESATLLASPELIEAALELLDKQTILYANTVPRGAQTWEIPLHTPDILASGHLVKAYVLGYIISGREDYLEQARYWAWTGVPFVYLVNPTEGKIGPYATIPVFGATNWKGSWFGRPVQWCGLVYASALHLLTRYDPEGPWSQIAEGVTASGLQMTWPLEDADRSGLLPDFIQLKSQSRDGPAINPGTTQAHVPELFDVGKIYDVRRLPINGCFIHAPCAIRDVVENDDGGVFTVDGWGIAPGSEPYSILISGWKEPTPYMTVWPLRQGSDQEPNRSSVHRASVAGAVLLIIDVAGPAKIQFVKRMR
jgi:hypothetical protein